MDTVIYLHIACAFLSLALLVIRGGMQLNHRDWRAIKPLRILPHLTDTLLILSGLAIMFAFGYGLSWWLIAKFLLLIVYVIFAAKFFSRKTTEPKPASLAMALAAFIGAILIAYFH